MTAVIIGSSGLVQPVDNGGLAEHRVVTGATLASSGGSVDLLSFPYRMARATGLTGPDSDVELDLLPGVDGGYIVGADSDRAGLYLSSLEPTITVLVEASSPVGTSVAVEDLRTLLRARRNGDVTLTVTRANGESRSLRMRHVPKAGDFDPQFHGGSLRPVLLRFVAPSPFWLGAPGQAGPWSVGGALPGFYPFGPTWEVSSSTVLGEANPVAVGGDEITWPTVTVTGPATSVEVSRADGRSWTLTPAVPLALGETLVVRHDPQAILGGLQVEGPAAANWSQYLEDGSDLFELRPGVEAITVLVAGSGTGTSARVDWPTRYESAV